MTDNEVTAEMVDLVARAQAGDGRAFAEIYDRYVERVYRFASTRVGGDRALAEDLTSEVFLRALRGIRSFTWTGRDIGAWLLTIARNLVYDHFKSRRSMTEALGVRHDLGMIGYEIVDPEDEVLSRLTNAELHSAIRRLTREQREVVYWRFLQGYSIAETAVVMGKNQGAIKALQYRAIGTLHALIAREESPIAVGA